MHRFSKSEFRTNIVMPSLNLDATILEQSGVVVQYQDDDVVKTVPAKHGIITLFKIDNKLYLLGIKTVDPYR